MERAAVQTVVESVRHPPALYWGVVSAAALCSVWGTFALAKRSKIERTQRISGGKVKPGVHAFKRLRRQYAENLRPHLEDLVYLTMFLLNLLVGVFYWILDSVLERHRVSSEKLVVSSILSSCVDSDDLRTVDDAEALYEAEVLNRPRRGQIKRLRTRWAWARSKPKSNPRLRCECWGWRVKDLVLEENFDGHGFEAPQSGLLLSQSATFRNEIRTKSENPHHIAQVNFSCMIWLPTSKQLPFFFSSFPLSMSIISPCGI